MKLKEEDKKLLNLIQRGDMCVPRVTKLAHELGLPTSTVQTKLEKFRRLGLITGFSAILDPGKVGKGLTAFWFARVGKGKGADLSSLPKRVLEIPQVNGIYFISGEWDYLFKARVRDHREYYEVAEKLARRYQEQAGMGVFAPKTFKDSHKVLVD